MSNAKRHAKNAADKLGHVGEVVIMDQWDDHDEWASVMLPLFDLLGAMYLLGAIVPVSYNPGLSIRKGEPESEDMEQLLEEVHNGQLTLKQMEYAITELELARDVVKAEGRDY